MHDDNDLEDRRIPAAPALDPRPAAERGISLSLRRDAGGPAKVGVEDLFAPGLPGNRIGGGAVSYRQAEAAWSFPAFGGRFTGSPPEGLRRAVDPCAWRRARVDDVAGPQRGSGKPAMPVQNHVRAGERTRHRGQGPLRYPALYRSGDLGDTIVMIR